ncbi:hypothetical protein RISK_003023 [Rhodopirellula islandica]|uniref:Uncharacterized protein n=1 Tax=Rhodopirellula islandica TaxID=595434 RepID=A0A0J1BDZ3_RHOIS|nr:hypothetical protein RISK_003023 [Rhodopirellula islandica]
MDGYRTGNFSRPCSPSQPTRRRLKTNRWSPQALIGTRAEQLSRIVPSPSIQTSVSFFPSPPLTPFVSGPETIRTRTVEQLIQRFDIVNSSVGPPPRHVL